MGYPTLIDKLAAWWPLDESSGTRGDAHGANDLTDNNTVAQATGKLSGAASFTSANSEYLSIASNAALQAGDVDFMIGVWVYLKVKGAVKSIVTKWDSTGDNREYRLFYQASVDRFQIQISDDGIAATTTLSADTLGSPTVNTWYFILAWHDPTADTLNIQVNNGGVDSAAHSTGIYVGSADFMIGARPVTPNYLDGYVDEAFIWKQLLSADERAAVYNASYGINYNRLRNPGSNPLDSNLIAWWELNESSGTRVDSYGSNDLTDFNTVGSISGQQGNAAYFQAANNEYLWVADNVDVSMGNIDFTFGAWVYLNTMVQQGGLLGKWRADTNQREYLLYYNTTLDRFQFVVSSDGTSSGVSSVNADSYGAPSTGVWYFVIAWHDAAANTLNIEVNHSGVDSVVHAGGVHNDTVGFNVGRYIDITGTSRFWDGHLDEALIYKRVLTAAERLFLYNQGCGRGYSLWQAPTPGALVANAPVVKVPAVGLYDTRIRLRARARDTYLTTRVR